VNLTLCTFAPKVNIRERTIVACQKIPFEVWLNNFTGQRVDPRAVDFQPLVALRGLVLIKASALLDVHTAVFHDNLVGRKSSFGSWIRYDGYAERLSGRCRALASLAGQTVYDKTHPGTSWFRVPSVHG
jgi:hypothetical protein